MLYLFHGTNTQLSLSKARTLVKQLHAKKPDSAFVEVDADHWNVAAIQEHAGGQGLFSAKYVVLLNRVTENAEAKDEIGKLTEIMQESENIFIVVEGKLNVDIKKALEKNAKQTVVSDVEKVGAGASGGKRGFNAFALADALGAREPGRAWSLYRQAIDAGQEIEPIVGMLFWKVKTMISSGISSTGKYSKEELHALAEKLITTYHDGHRGVVDLELSVEKLLIGLGK